jgi:Anthranilate synthase component I, N terminal region
VRSPAGICSTPRSATCCVTGCSLVVQVPQRISEAWRPYADPQLPAVFTGGWVGYCGYDTVRYGYSGQLQPFPVEAQLTALLACLR